MRIFRKFKSFFASGYQSPETGQIQVGQSQENTTAAELRLREIYGDDTYDLQMLYESWAVKDSWKLKEQALPLLLGIKPDSIPSENEELVARLDDLWSHARKCVEQGVLEVTNRQGKEEAWEISPVEAYRWATIGRIEVPDELSTLMEFISSTVNKKNLTASEPTTNSNVNDAADQFVWSREQVLGMALAILAAYPDKCRNSKGRVKVGKIISIINQKADFWLGNKKTGLSETAMKDLLNKWLNTLPEQMP